MPGTIVFYVSGHGFGHASRDIEVMNAFLARRPDARVCVRTAAARWLFDLTVRGPFDFAHVDIDFGVVQIDALTPDLPGTLDRALAFYRNSDEVIAREADALRELRANVVVADVPPLAFAAADRAGVPSIALTNFTWDWIYDDYARTIGRGEGLVPQIQAWHAFAREAWRLPMHGGFGGFQQLRDLPLVARRSQFSREDARARFGWGDHAKVVLVSFGGVGMHSLPLERVASRGEFVIVSTEEPTLPESIGPGREPSDHAGEPHVQPVRPKPDSAGGIATDSGESCDAASGGGDGDAALLTVRNGVTFVNEGELYASGLRYEDLVKAADVVVTKPGYGIIAECIANDTALLYTSRGRFAEYDVLVRDMPRWARSHFISNDDLREGRWTRHLRALFERPAPPERARVDGAQVAASWLEELHGSE